MQQANTNHR